MSHFVLSAVVPPDRLNSLYFKRSQAFQVHPRLTHFVLCPVHTEEGNTSPLGDVRTEHFMRMTKEEWEEICFNNKKRYLC